MATADRPEMLLLSLAYTDFFDELYKPLLERLAAGENLKRTKAASNAIHYLEKKRPHRHDVTDDGLTKRKHSSVIEKV
jgi:phage regulator Rha-like protein